MSETELALPGLSLPLFRNNSLFHLENSFIKPHNFQGKKEHSLTKRQVGHDCLLGCKMTMQGYDYFICEILSRLHALPSIAFCLFGCLLPTFLSHQLSPLTQAHHVSTGMWRLIWKSGGIHGPEQIPVFSGRRLSRKGSPACPQQPCSPLAAITQAWATEQLLKEGGMEGRRKETPSLAGEDRREKGMKCPWTLLFGGLDTALDCSDQRWLWCVQLYSSASC